MSPNLSTVPSDTQISPQSAQTRTSDGFELDVALLEVADSASLVSITNDNCGSTCGACVTNCA